jgi:hypothetical protein
MNTRFILFSLLLLSAITGKSQVEISLTQPVTNNFIESELITDISFIPLQYEKAGTILNDMELKVDKNDYFILDSRVTQNVYRFSESGELLNTISTQKQIIGENSLPVLNNPVKFNINPAMSHVEIFNFENSSLNRFSYSGKKVDQIVFPVSPSDFIRDRKGNYWIYTGWNNKESQFRLIHADSNGNIIERLMRLVSKCTPTESFAFSSSNDVIYLWELLGNSTYKIENGKATETFIFNYGLKNLTPLYHSMESYDSYQMINRNGYYSIKKYLENKNYAYFFLNYTAESHKELFHIIYDKKNKKLYRYYEEAAIALDKAQALTENDELVFLVTPRNIRRLASSESVTLLPVYEGLIEASDTIKNTMIVKMKLSVPEDAFNESGN